MMAARPGCGRRRALIAAVASLSAPAVVRAQGGGGAYPARSVRVVNAYSPGGTADVVCRIVFAKLSERLGQSFAVENRPGAAGTVAAQSVAARRRTATPCSTMRRRIR
jgi:tripartite-type tricarboxylate transporter receptor subunit TctC